MNLYEVLLQIKEESCFVSLNYLSDLRHLKSQYSSGRQPRATHLVHQYILPDFNTRDVGAHSVHILCILVLIYSEMFY